MNSEKKISFGFNKLSKKPPAINKPQEKTVDYIVCLEEQSIKLKHEPKEITKTPLVIPLKDNQKDLLDRVRDIKGKQINVTKAVNEEVEDTRPDSELTIEELATREVIRDAKLKLQQTDSKHKTFVVPMKNENELLLDGERESTLTDYENVPVNDFGLAMLRGMGWKEGIGIGKNPSKAAVMQAPELRPKGLGLGANPSSSDQHQPACDKEGKVLILKRGSYAKVVAGSKKGTYCEVQGLDDEAGRVIVKTSLKSEILTFNEFMLVPVTKEEYSKNSKVINSAKFEEYKETEKVKIEAEIKSEKNDRYFQKYEESNEVSRKERNNDKSEVKTERYYSSDEVYSDDSKSRNKLESKSKKYNNSSDSDSDDRRSKRIHKRKDKRRHRDKSRSPNRTKHKSGRKSSKNKQRHRSSSESDYERKKSKSRNRNSSDSDDDRYKRKNKR
ncbi:G-patch domain and KOW motifs-containing protein homolog 1 [Diorhabda carinulata]|uniref:G-patch domain and KOW motifs-containing protein homolog 1 n=1 Tax=Diorhabda carinulata TaxID=1163345 RepID=UPI0025A09502|nr:G-patch domain and KOW motifs-containing protein homolog 1 [Diorhabda carinulata]